MSSTLDQNALVYSAQLQLKKYGSFINVFHSTLKSLQGGETSRRRIISTVFDDTLEAATLHQIVDSDNKMLSKIILTFSGLYDEVKEISHEAQTLLFNFVLMDENLTELELKHEDRERPTQLVDIDFGHILELLFRIKYFIEYSTQAATDTIQQLGSLFEVEKQFVRTTQSIHFQSVFHYIAAILVEIVRFWELLKSAGIKNYWTFLKQSLNSVKYNLETFDFKYDFTTVQGVEGVLVELEHLLTKNLFEGFTHSLNTLRTQLQPKALGVFSGHFASFLKTTLTEIRLEVDELKIFKVTVMAVVFHHLFGNLEKKLLKTLLEVHVKTPALTIFGNILWPVDKFLKANIPSLFKGHERFTTDLEKARQKYLQSHVQAIQLDTKNFYLTGCVWALEMKESFGYKLKDMNLTEMKRQSALLLQGINIAGQISQQIKSLTNLHVLLSVPMTLLTLTSICKLIELLQIIRVTFSKLTNQINQSVQLLLQHQLYKILSLVTEAKRKYLASNLTERKLDIISALNICEKALYGPPTGKRIFVARLALGASEPTTIFDATELQSLNTNLRETEQIIEALKHVEHLCDFSFLYWHQSILPLHMKQVLSSEGNPEQFTFILQSIDDCYTKITARKFPIVDDFTLTTLRTENLAAFQENVIQKICQQLETYLRLDYHSNLQVDSCNPFLSNRSYFAAKLLAKLQPMEVFGRQVLLKDHIEQYLNTTYYNLTTISLHDWRTYGEMRKLAKFKFGLDTTDDYLPTRTIEQGLDILEIMRNINVFVTKYLYNLNNQIFIEQSSSNSKYLTTININHVANSLRAHGVGIVNTTINFTYQFLRNKFQVFSQFMYDEQIKSRLIKEAKFFGDAAKNTDPKPYTYERAENFSRNMRKLGQNKQGMSYLDMLRTLISHIGNALGYVRLVRSGAIRCSADASVSLPDLDEDLKFVFMTKEDALGKVTVESAEALETSIDKLNKTYAEGVEYFKLLVDTFAPFFRNPKHIHLKCFYLIVPALMINYIEFMLTAKDKLSKKDKSGALFTDDGFAIGLAYILKLLDQVNEFNSLHWFKSLKQKYKAERDELKQRRSQSGSSVDEKLQQTFALTEKRMTNFQQEFDLLYYNLSSAKIFFQ